MLRKLLLLILAAAPAAAPALRGGEPPAEEKKGPARVLVVERVVTEYGLTPVMPGAEEPAERKMTKLAERAYTVKIGPDRIRESAADTGAVTVVRLDRGVVWLMDSKEKTYREVSLAEINERVADARARLKRRLPLVEDPEQAARLKKLLGVGSRPEKVTVERPGGTRKILGENCRKIVVKLGGEELFSAWTSDRPVPLAKGKWLRLGGCFPAGAANALAAVRGLVLEAVYPMPDGGRLEVTTRRISEAAPAAGDFEHPAKLDYKPVGRGGRSRRDSGKTDKTDKADKTGKK